MKTRHDMSRFGYYRVASVCPVLELGNPEVNGERTLAAWKTVDGKEASVVVFPELGITGYTIDDLLTHSETLARARTSLLTLAEKSKKLQSAAVVGAPYQASNGRLYNGAFVIHGGKVQGMIPKSYLPSYGEFYEPRWFTSGKQCDLIETDEHLGTFRVCPKQLFKTGELLFAIEICEDLWAPVPPSGELALAGAHLILNLSASNDLVGKSEYRRQLVANQSARLNCAYAYSAAGPLESTRDLVFGGHLMIAENGSLLGESHAFSFSGDEIIVEIDVAKLNADRRRNSTFGTSSLISMPITVLQERAVALKSFDRKYPRHPFVPSDPRTLKERAEEIVTLQATGLSRRLKALPGSRLIIGISGGLDSTLALLVSVESMKQLGRKPSDIIGVTMPGFGTTDRTKDSAHQLAKALGIGLREISIEKASEQHLRDLGRDTKKEDIVFENAQARERTQILFDLGNAEKAIVVGTGDLSELWLGWCTYNGDQMAHYNVNVSVPKTLVRHLVSYYAETRADDKTKRILEKVLNTPISPELKRPDKAGQISQLTEDVLGPYEVHDFFLFHHLRNAFTPKKILLLAELTWASTYSKAQLKQWLKMFYERGLRSQFKRTTLPAGPKIGSVSVSPRGDLRLPDEIDPVSWLRSLLNDD